MIVRRSTPSSLPCDPDAVQVPEDFICEHGMPQPWATCTECMLLPKDEQPEPPKPKPAPKPEPKPRKRAASSRSSVSKGERAPRAPRAPAARLPRHADDTKPELTGRHDLAYEVPDDNVSFHVRGPESGWLAISSLPTDLRPNGFVYLQVDGDVVARARVKGIGYRDKRWSQEPSATAADMGSGPTIEIHDDSWERMRVWLGADGERPVKGYRYLQTVSDEEIRVVTD